MMATLGQKQKKMIFSKCKFTWHAIRSKSLCPWLVIDRPLKHTGYLLTILKSLVLLTEGSTYMCIWFLPWEAQSNILRYSVHFLSVPTAMLKPQSRSTFKQASCAKSVQAKIRSYRYAIENMSIPSTYMYLAAVVVKNRMNSKFKVWLTHCCLSQSILTVQDLSTHGEPQMTSCVQSGLALNLVACVLLKKRKGVNKTGC